MKTPDKFYSMIPLEEVTGDPRSRLRRGVKEPQGGKDRTRRREKRR
jgi:hypothetical protein